MNQSITDILKRHSLRRTPMREQVLNIFIAANREAIAHPDLERLMPDADRITLYRTLKSFEEKGILHQVVDTGNAAKYALCHEACSEHQHHDHHAHFHCQDCGKTVCLDAVLPANIQTPPGFQVRQAHLVLEGLCAKCGRNGQ